MAMFVKKVAISIYCSITRRIKTWIVIRINYTTLYIKMSVSSNKDGVSFGIYRIETIHLCMKVAKKLSHLPTFFAYSIMDKTKHCCDWDE